MTVLKKSYHMQMLHHTKNLGIVQVDETVWKKLTPQEKQEMEKLCDEKLKLYFDRLNQRN